MKILVIATKRIDELRKPLITAGCDVSVISPNTDVSLPRRYVHYIYHLWKEIRTENYDAILTSGAGFIGMTAILVGRVYQIPVLPRIAGNKFSECKYYLLYDISKLNPIHLMHSLIRFVLFVFCMLAATSVVVVSNNLKNRYQMFSKYANQNIIVVPVSIDTPSHGSEEDTDYSTKQTLLTVTNLDFKGKYEGVKKLVAAAVEILGERPNVEYVIAGSGIYYEELREYINSNIANESIQARLHIPGYVSPISPIYRKSNIFLYISYQDGYPNVILEAMSHGLPIITNNDVGMSEQIVHGQSGIFVDGDNPGDIREQITSLLDNAKKRESLGSRAIAQVKSANSHSTVGKQYVQALQSVID